MMSPLEKIKQGIINGDINIISVGFTELTGQIVRYDTPDIKTVSKKRGRPSKNKNIITLDESFSKPISLKVDEILEARTRAQRGKFENMFVDDGRDATEDKIADKKIRKASPPPVSKGQRKSPMVESRCISCSKVEKIHKQFILEGTHTCQKCLKGKIGK